MDMYEEVHMKRTTLAKKLRIALAVMAFAGCATSFAADSTADAAAAPAAKTQNEMKRQLTREATYMEEQLTLTQEWDKTFPKSDKVNHRKVTFHNRYGITLAADLYEPKHYEGKLAAIAVCGPFGEQAAGLYAQTMAERGFLTIAFDPSFTGESGGQPRYVASPDINTEDFQAAVDFLSVQDNVDPEKIGIRITSTRKKSASSAFAAGAAWP